MEVFYGRDILLLAPLLLLCGMQLIWMRIPAGRIGVPDRFIPHGSHGRLLEEAGLSPEKIHGRIQEALGRKKR